MRSGTISLGGVDGDITIGSRLHLSSYISGGQRRVSRADRDVGKVIRKCWNHLHPGGGDMGEEEEGLFGGMDVDEEDEVIASAMDNMS